MSSKVDENSDFDVVEVDAKLVASTVSAAVVGASDQQERKIEWLLESGLDEWVILPIYWMCPVAGLT